MKFEIQKYVIYEDSLIKDALSKIQENQLGMVCVASDDEKIVGVCTDGDIRLGLLSGLRLADKISKCINRNFVSAKANEPRLSLLKKIDSGVRFIPVLDDGNELLMVVSAEFLPLTQKKKNYIRSRAPVRISFGGGGSDLTRYFIKDGGAVINGAISLYSHATMRILDDESITINSLDLGDTFKAKNLEVACRQIDCSNFGLILALINIIKPSFGFELSIHSDFTIGSGLGGSATMCAAVLGCFNHLKSDPWDQHELAEIAFQAERLSMGIAGGWQDQYASVFGGINFLEFQADETLISPLRIDPNTLLELEESLVMCNTGIVHNSGEIHVNQRKNIHEKDINNNIKKNVELTYKIRSYLLSGQLEKLGEALNDSWELKKTFSNHISNKHLDSIYDGALQNGATGGKLLGAGGGGYFLFYIPPFKKYNFLKYLEDIGLQVQPFCFEANGLKTWSFSPDK